MFKIRMWKQEKKAEKTIKSANKDGIYIPLFTGKFFPARLYGKFMTFWESR